MAASSALEACSAVVLTDTKLSALSALVAIAIGLCVAYLALDKLRHRNELTIQVKRLSEVLDPIQVLLSRCKCLTLTERVYLGLEFYSVNYEFDKDLKINRKDVNDGSLDSNLEFMLFFITRLQADRWVLKFSASILFVIEFYITIIMLRGNSCEKVINTDWFQLFILFLCAISYIVPAIVSPVAALMLKMCRDAVHRHIKDAKNSQVQQASNATIPGVQV